jgi:hypothetical protein
VPLEIGTSAIEADRPASDRTDRVPDRSSERDGDVGWQPLTSSLAAGSTASIIIKTKIA